MSIDNKMANCLILQYRKFIRSKLPKRQNHPTSQILLHKKSPSQDLEVNKTRLFNFDLSCVVVPKVYWHWHIEVSRHYKVGALLMLQAKTPKIIRINHVPSMYAGFKLRPFEFLAASDLYNGITMKKIFFMKFFPVCLFLVSAKTARKGLKTF